MGINNRGTTKLNTGRARTSKNLIKGRKEMWKSVVVGRGMEWVEGYVREAERKGWPGGKR